MDKYDKMPKREPLRQCSKPRGSLTDNRRFWKPKIEGAKKRRNNP